MPVPRPKFVIVDTNCYIRLLFSPLRPILGSTLGGRRLMTLTDLASECGASTGAAAGHPWLLDQSIQAELAANRLKLRQPKSGQVEAWAKHFRQSGNKLLREHCLAAGLSIVRELSLADARCLAAAEVTKSLLATDEWPLTLVAKELSDVEQVLTSVDVVRQMETDLKISRAQRIAIVSGWLRDGQNLPRDWQSRYLVLFGEEPPDAQT